MRRNKFVNFQRYFDANRGAATAQADRLAAQQQKAAQGAQQATQGLVGQMGFQAGLTQPKQLHIAQQGRDYSDIGLAAKTNIGAAAVQAMPMQTGFAGQFANVGTSPGQLAEANQRAQATYQGPTQFSDVGGYDDVLKQNLAAQKGLNELGHEGGIEALNQQLSPGLTEGESRFSAALTGAAGRSKFDAIRGRFMLEKDWKSAEEKAKQLGLQGAEKARADAAMWAEEADRQRLAGGPAVQRELGYDIQEDKGPRKNGLENTRALLPDYETFAQGTSSNNIQSGAYWFKKNVPLRLWESLSNPELRELVDTIAAAGGERNKAVDEIIAKLRAKHGV